MRHLKNWLFLSLLLSQGAGCGPEKVPLEDYAREMRTAYCDWASGCGEFGEEQACLYYLGANESLFLPVDTINGVSGGSIRYDEAQAGACIEALIGSSCALYSFEDTLYASVCADVFTGVVEDGQLCYLDMQCASSWCDLDNCDSACCAGACLTIPQGGAIGQPCPLGLCDENTYCHWDTETCQARKAASAPCDYSEECSSGLLCLPGTCELPRQEGEPCLNGQCGRMGLTCDPTSTLCVLVQKAGEICNPDIDLCGTSLSCNSSTHTCTNAPNIGAPCVGQCSGYQVYCAYEDAYEGTCEQRKANGSSCTWSDECVSLYCDNVCITPPVCVY